MPKADIIKRFIAAVIDGAITSLLSVTIVGGMIYFLIKDGLFDGRSVGKKVMGLKVIEQGTNAPCNYVNSAIRNILFVVPFVGFIEIVLVILDAEGIRLGDKIAKTQVIEG